MFDNAVPVARILIADDDPDFRGVLRQLLEKEGYACDEVGDSEGVKEELGQRCYDMLVADIDMPGNRRLELVQTLTEVPDRPPVVLVTGSPSIGTATRSVGLAVFAYLTKPCDVPALRQTIREGVANGRVRRALRESEERVRAWSEDIGRIRTLVERSPEGASGVQSYLALTLGNLIAAIGDFAGVADVVARSDAHKKRVETATMVKALQETVAVLEGTRHLFKSKELGTLRKKLEELLRAAPAS